MAIGKRGSHTKWMFGISTRVSTPPVWSTIEAKCDEKFPATLRSAIEALLQDYNIWFDVGRAGWTYAELNKAAKKVESAIFEFREMVIYGKLLPEHPEGGGVAAVQFASRARQAADLVPVLKAASEVEISPEEADGRLDVLQELAARNKKILELKPVDFRGALAETDRALRKLLASITPLIELGALSSERSNPEIEARRRFVKGLTQVLEQHNFPTDVSEQYPDKSLFLRLYKALGFGETPNVSRRKPLDEAENKAQAIAKMIIRYRDTPN